LATIDWGINTAPGLLNRQQMEQALAIVGGPFKCCSPDCSPRAPEQKNRAGSAGRPVRVGAHPKEYTDGTSATTFGRARADFEKAWRVFLSNRTEADF